MYLYMYVSSLFKSSQFFFISKQQHYTCIQVTRIEQV